MLRVLIVEGEEYLRRLLRLSLVDVETEVYEAATVAEAFGLLHSQPIDLVLMERAPGYGNWELIERIRATPNLAHLPILVVTSRVGDIEQLTAEAAGADDFIAKPFSPAELKRRVQRFAEQGRSASTYRANGHDGQWRERFG